MRDGTTLDHNSARSNSHSRAHTRKVWDLLGGLTSEVVLLVGAILMLMPILWMFSSAFKTPAEILHAPSLIPHQPTLENFWEVFTTAPFGRWLLNSLLLATVSTFSILATSAIAGYVLAKFSFPGRTVLFMTIMATAIVPFEVYMIPIYLTTRNLHLINTLPGIMVPFLIMSFGIFFIRQNVLASIPDELIEAGRIDGASELWIFGRVVIPLLGGPLSALGIFAFMQAWNQFVWPLLVANSKMLYTAEVGLALFQTGYTINFGAVSAGAVMAVVPILAVFLMLRRQIINGVALSGLKG